MDTTHSEPCLRDQIFKWRQERQARLASRILRNRQAEVSSMVFGVTATSSDVTSGSTLTKPPLSTAPVFKRKPCRNPKTRPENAPKINHTVTSRLRMIKANPLLEARGIITLSSNNKKTVNSSAARNTEQLNAVPSAAVHPSSQHVASFNSSRFQNKKITSVNSATNDRQSRRCNPLPIKKNSSVRRSLSAGPPVKSAHSKVNDTLTFRRFQSVANVQDVQNMVIKMEEQLDGGGNMVSSLPLTPKIYQTPHKTRCELPSISVQRKEIRSSLLSVYAQTPDVMRKDLSDWLHKRGKSLESFHHLECYGLHASDRARGTVNSQNHKLKVINYRHKPKVNCRRGKQIKEKENHTSNTQSTLSRLEQETCLYEECAGSGTEEEKENVCVKDTDLLVQDAVKDLLNIIHLGYPWNRCEEWLIMICRFSPDVKHTPIYWECLAALEGVRGHFKSAVDCYEKAVIQGASPTNVNESVDQLMEKFNMLNLNCDFENDRTSVKTPRARILDACNIFKSRVIKFALKENNLNRTKSDVEIEAPSPHYIVTPVRHSTRTSLSHYRTTPGLQYVDSLSKLEPNVRKSMVFHSNPAFDS